MNDLPTLDDRRIDEIELALFAEIARERAERRVREDETSSRTRRRRRTWWAASGAAAAVIVVAAVIAPQLTATTGGAAGSAAPVTAPDSTLETSQNGDVAREDGDPATESAPFALDDTAEDGTAGDATTGDETVTAGAREVVATASATLTVDDPRAAAQAIADAATAAGGYVESVSVGSGTSALPGDAVAWPAPSGSSWVSVRVPATSLETVMDGLADVGEVETSQVTRDDVTTQAIDLRARVAAGQASVERLTALVSEAASVSDLLAAESTLAERQASLESLQQQLTALESQVALSSLSVQLDAPAEKVDADPAGFGDGVATGWNGLVATFNGIVVGLGFLLPWLAVLGLTAALVWLAMRTTRRRRTR
ncbi:DUF4349 domain-containing protein [Microbacterium arborescens]|uniref:DUF4349 domain-containing protein n=1 Tax=Microbacterium arborescens TaxID=33883 RepID=UPI003C72E6BB